MLTVSEKDKKNTKNPPVYDGLKMSLSDFFAWKPAPEDGWLYEWDNGLLKAKFKAMKNTERKIIAQLMQVFATTPYFKNGDVLFQETDCYFELLNRTRIPDIAYFSASEIVLSAQGKHPIPTFVIEIISENDNINEVEQKLDDYFAVGVQVVWHIFPKFKRVKIYIASKKEILLCLQGDTCDGSPVLEDFKITVNQLFA